MPTVLLKPYVLTYKNRLIKRANDNAFWRRDLLVALISLIVMLFIYWAVYGFLDQVQSYGSMFAGVPQKMISISMFVFFLLLLFSNTIAALAFFFSGKDLPLLLSLPISNARLYTTKLLVTALNSGWIFVLFVTPSIFAYYNALDLPLSFLLLAILLLIPFLLVPAAISSCIVTLFVNIVPVHRLREIMLIASIGVVLGIFLVGEQFPQALSTEESKLEATLGTLLTIRDPNPYWLPSRWMSDILASFLSPSTDSILWPSCLLITTTLGLVALGFLAFDALFMRGWTISLRGGKNLKFESSGLTPTAGRLLMPFQPQLRALMYKEIKMFLRDTTQCVQLILLLMLSFVYLYNFKTLRSITTLSEETYTWWQAGLCISGIALGGCVISAIATRFVYPSISLEGAAYWVVRAAPLSTRDLLRNKFWIWLIPVSALSVVLFVSSAWAIQVPVLAVFVCGFIAVSISIGVVGVAVGIGAVYAKFDWDSPTQVTASFGSLIYMLLSFAVIMITLIPAGLLIIVASVPGIQATTDSNDFLTVVACLSFLTIYINLAAARSGLSSGDQALKSFEK